MSKDTIASPRIALLGFLIPGSGHPYELHKEFERELGQVWYVGPSHFYKYLKQLAEAGLVTVKLEPRLNRPARIIYQLMPLGEAEFQIWLHQPTPHVRHMRLEFLARLYFFRRFALPGLAQLIADQKALLWSRSEALDRELAETNDEYRQLVLEFRKSEIQAIIGWLDRCLEGDAK